MADYYKLMRKDEIHNGYQFSSGLHVDPVPWNIKSQCSRGGFYFCELKDIPKWIDLYPDNDWVRHVTLPPDARVHHESNGKSKADKIILTGPVPCH